MSSQCVSYVVAEVDLLLGTLATQILPYYVQLEESLHRIPDVAAQNVVRDYPLCKSVLFH